ncbi:MAG: hypothetical protein NUW01_08445, partial [Gemmatimonadaceae bacterium]|nr:hypothetical protein [Gemmatimonadaceae bacterium]
MTPARLAFALGEPVAVAREVQAAADAARAAVAGLTADLRGPALALALAEHGDGSLHRYGLIGGAAWGCRV